jgi:Domain of unknown function (DUF4214)
VNEPSLQSSINSLEEILELHDEAFVKAAYRAILGRVPDPSGLENYLSQVRAGVNKAQILRELAQSPEGVATTRGLRGMQHIGKHPPMWRRIVRQMTGRRRESIDRQLRILDNRLYLAEQAIANQTSMFAELLSSLHRGEPRELQSIDPKSSHGTFNLGEVGGAPAPSQLSQGLARTYIELKTAIARKPKEH